MPKLHALAAALFCLASFPACVRTHRTIDERLETTEAANVEEERLRNLDMNPVSKETRRRWKEWKFRKGEGSFHRVSEDGRALEVRDWKDRLIRAVEKDTEWTKEGGALAMKSVDWAASPGLAYVATANNRGELGAGAPCGEGTYRGVLALYDHEGNQRLMLHGKFMKVLTLMDSGLLAVFEGQTGPPGCIRKSCDGTLSVYNGGHPALIRVQAREPDRLLLSQKGGWMAFLEEGRWRIFNVSSGFEKDAPQGKKEPWGLTELGELRGE